MRGLRRAYATCTRLEAGITATSMTRPGTRLSRNDGESAPVTHTSTSAATVCLLLSLEMLDSPFIGAWTVAADASATRT